MQNLTRNCPPSGRRPKQGPLFLRHTAAMRLLSIGAALLLAFSALAIAGSAASEPRQNPTVSRSLTGKDTTAQGVPLDADHFPDDAFRSFLGQRFDLDDDGVLSKEERESVTRLDIRNKGIYSLEGIGAFPSLTSLNCIGNELTALPLEQLTGLTSLLCNENQLTSLDLFLVPSLTLLHCHDNQLAALDVSGLPELTELACGDNPFTSLDLSYNKKLSYFLYMGGPLKTLTLRENDALAHLWCCYSLVTALDLSQTPNLEQLGIQRSDITFLDLSATPDLTDLLASDNQLLAIRAGQSTPTADFAGQRPVTVQLAEGETTFNLDRLGVPIAPDCISDLTGAELSGNLLSGLADGTTVTYRYTDGALSFTASLQFEVSNGWTDPLEIEDWTYGQPASSPHAQAQYGQPVYLYSDAPDGVFSSEVPQNAGVWYVKAVVPPQQDHAGLEQVAEFHIWKAHPNYTIPTGLSVMYGEPLGSVVPGEGFVWETPDKPVGDVGQRSFPARY